MAKAKLRQILAADKGKVPYLEKQKKLQKEARKRKRLQDDKEGSGNDNGDEEEKMEVDGEWESESDEEDSEDDERVIDMSKLEDSDSESEDEDEDEDDDEEEEEEEEEKTKKSRNGILKASKATTAAADKDEDDEEDEEDEEEDEEDIPLSEISEEDHDPEADIIPRQKLTIDNHSALLASHASIALPIKKSTPFSTHHTITTSTPVEIKDVHDDLTRELAFYTQALDAAKQGRALLLAEGAPFTRPTDYFAEMVKSEEHMGKIKEKIKEQAAMKQASADAKRQRDLKKFGKQVQVARLQERQKEKREMLDKINVLKRKRAGADLGDENEGDPFDIAIEKASKVNGREGRDRRGPNAKRQKKNEKFGYGGKKKFSKSGDAVSSGDLTGFNSKGMKKNSFGSGKKVKAPRPGKSKRQARR
ncbi:rRNA-processing protein and EBNA1-binding protein ebp2 [Orbilia oligospora]|uniref:rRNA-processing protein and EBNA1-binding protein ebp2 n=1 Tax=Orbilia oligospora TaxID=2813651 RepID=A0A6G1M8Q8_ORBOL|nr:rRNA-processing protein and EBNA1-binding protein ebp2 [Orbilia oligospora]KAF3216844.1 rRNA-processing protein and EBNA1-binding protein ebp2 [Orbilia oligospora]KAF3222129.1 rRNA-processing protein and EBNA1-binding protein ebp2 [Orbilia oligospora]KAF3249962.1 rRNA-processing protein and EBNA1-binding protein ebp2 [Orbilia oligospora]